MDLTDRLEALTPQQRELLQARLRAKGIAAPRPRSIRPIPGRERMEYFETSLDQERLWFVDQMEPGNPAYNIHTASRLFGPLDLGLMRQAVNASIARHEVLRTTFRVIDGRPVQVVAKAQEIDLPLIDLGPVPPQQREAVALAAAVEAAAVRFDLERGPLVRVSVGRLADDEHVLMICMHHAITDRWSFDIFEHEISRAYVALRDGGVYAPPPLPIQFADFAAWQREELSGERLIGHLDYWRSKLAGAPLVLDIPTDRPRPPVMTFNGARAYIVYPDELLTQLKELTQRANATMFMTVLAGLALVCWKYSGQRDMVLGSAIADRNRPETEELLGYFLNMLMLRVTIDPQQSFRDLLRQVRETCSGAYAHQDVPYAALVAELKPRQDPSRNPLMQISFIYLDFPVIETPEYAGLQSAPLHVDNGASRFDMTLACTELPGVGLDSYIEYNSDLFDRDKVERMLRHLGVILAAVAAQPDRPLRDLDMLETAEREALQVVNASARPYADVLLHDAVGEAAARTPDAAAIVHDGVVVTFGQLDRAAARLARRLRAAGVRTGSLVGVCAERGPAQAAALLGALRAGAAYLPLDPSLPQARLAQVLAAASPAAVLVESGLRAQLPEALPAALELDDGPASGKDPATAEGSAPKEAAWQDDAGPRPSSQDLAYVMFTSGSTGAPKGVMVPHRGIVNRLQWAQERYPIRPGDRVLHNASFAFDIAAWELLAPLAVGATVVIPREGEHKDPGALARLMEQEQVTVAHFVPSVLRLALEEPALARCDALRAVFCGGEGMGREVHDRFFERLPGRTLGHFYGPTEASISCLYHDCTAELRPGPVPLGGPIANMRVHLLDDTLHPVPVGVPGELYLGGVGLARGYLGRPDLTAERFVPDPSSEAAGQRLYRTGDLARRNADGSLEFLGRRDLQVKLRGHRIELGEVQAALERLSRITAAAAAVHGEGDARQIVGYVVLADGEAQDEAALRAELRRVLPEVMVPAAIVFLERLPLGPNGKVDRAALPPPGSRTDTAHWVAPRTPVEEAIANIWSTLLRRERVSALDNFFDLGGDSLLATQAISRVRAAFDIELPLRRFFEGSTVEALAGAVEQQLIARIESMSEAEAAQRLADPRRFEATG